MQTGAREERLERGVVAGIVAFRWAAWAWLAAVLVVTRADLSRPAVALALAAVALAATVALTLTARSSGRVLRPAVALAELAIGVALLVGDGWVYEGEHTQSLGSAWPLAGAITVGAVGGPAAGIAGGVLLGLGRLTGTLLDDLAQPSTLSLVSTGVLYALAGAVAGFVMTRLRAAERQISAARAREEVARTLHDGVLQTLAVVQRRSSDTDLADLARDQERELRDYLFGSEATGPLVPELRRLADRFERHHGGRAEVVAVEEPPMLGPAALATVVGAVGESLTNAGKHGAAGHVTIFVEAADDELFCSVKDDGSGFDPAAVAEGVGIARSIRGRVAESGGRVEIDAHPGRGAEVRLWVPFGRSR